MGDHVPAAIRGVTSGSSFACPKCKSQSRTLDSRPANEGQVIRRRRVCIAPGCRHRWTTYELELPDGIELNEILVGGQAQLRIKDLCGRLSRGLAALNRELFPDA